MANMRQSGAWLALAGLVVLALLSVSVPTAQATSDVDAAAVLDGPSTARFAETKVERAESKRKTHHSRRHRSHNAVRNQLDEKKRLFNERKPAREVKERFKGATLHRRPVILLPGVMGSALEAKPLQSKLCGIEKDTWGRIWMDPFDKCRITGVGMDVTADGRSVDKPDRIIRVMQSNFGLDAVSDLAGPANVASWVGATQYYKRIIKNMEELGYQAGVDLFGSPYDWRRLPTENTTLEMFRLIQSVSTQTKKKVVIVSHSMGALRTNTFLKAVESDKYASVKALVQQAGYSSGKDWILARVGRWISLCAPLLGSPQTLTHLLSGSKMFELLFGILGTKDTDMTKLARTMETVSSLYIPMPEWEQVYESMKTTPIVEVKNKGRTIKFLAREYSALLKYAGLPPNEHTMSMRVMNGSAIRQGIEGPKVVTSYELPSFFYYSKSLPTIFRLRFDEKRGLDEDPAAKPIPASELSLLPKTDPPVQPLLWDSFSETKPEIVEKQPGDEVVPAGSLEWFKRWKSAEGTPVKSTAYNHAPNLAMPPKTSLYFKEVTGEHIALLHKNEEFIEDLLQHCVTPTAADVEAVGVPSHSSSSSSLSSSSVSHTLSSKIEQQAAPALQQKKQAPAHLKGGA